jgi:hypothetical protein
VIAPVVDIEWWRDEACDRVYWWLIDDEGRDPDLAVRESDRLLDEAVREADYLAAEAVRELDVNEFMEGLVSCVFANGLDLDDAVSEAARIFAERLILAPRGWGVSK